MNAMPSDTASSFGDLLRQYRRSRNLTQEALAAGAGVSVRAISDLERAARTHPYRETAISLANALELRGDERTSFLAAAQGRPREPTRDESLRPFTALPRPLTPLIGRQVELAQLVRWLRNDRLPIVTVTGPAGVGKTRLAIAVAAATHASFADGVVFVDLAQLEDPAQVASTLAAALGVPEISATPPLEIVRRVLLPRQMLLVLDNFEHLLAAGPIVSELVQAAPHLQVLTTGRAALRLQGEREFGLAPLPTPADDPPEDPPNHDGWEAVQLFVERARDVDSGFALHRGNASAIAEMCRRLDGLPLAIELAAARVKLLPPAMLLARMEHRFQLLTAGRRDAPSRQQTLEAAISWSFDLLEPDEQGLLRALSLFVGGWTLEAAERVGAARGLAVPLAVLAALVEQNLVVRSDRGSDPRYRMLETIREFAGLQLRAAGEETSARQGQLHYLLQLARDNDLECLDADVGLRLSRLRAEEANLRASLGWALDHDPVMALQILAELDFYWFLSDQSRVGIDLLTRALATDAGMQQARARALTQAAWLMSAVGDSTAAAPVAVAAQEMGEDLDEPQIVAWSLTILASVALSRGEMTEARSLFTRGLAQFEARDDFWGALVCLTEYGIAALDWGEPLLALELFARVRAIVGERSLPNRYHAHYLVNVADAYRHLGQTDQAIEASSQALALASDQGQYTTACAQIVLASLLVERGELERAADLVAQGLQFTWEMGDRWSLVQALEAVAIVTAAGAQPGMAARCLGAAAAIRGVLPYPIGAGQQPILNRLEAELRSQMGASDFTYAVESGRQPPTAEVVAEANRVLRHLAT
jgi:predicted ATPase/DNA-binding XRE family transcriptional regulator